MGGWRWLRWNFWDPRAKKPRRTLHFSTTVENVRWEGWFLKKLVSKEHIVSYLFLSFLSQTFAPKPPLSSYHYLNLSAWDPPAPVIKINLRIEAINTLILLGHGIKFEIVISLVSRQSGKKLPRDIYPSEADTHRHNKHGHHPSRHLNKGKSLLGRTVWLAMSTRLVDAVQGFAKVHRASLVLDAVAISGQKSPRCFFGDVFEKVAWWIAWALSICWMKDFVPTFTVEVDLEYVITFGAARHD